MNSINLDIDKLESAQKACADLAVIILEQGSTASSLQGQAASTWSGAGQEAFSNSMSSNVLPVLTALSVEVAEAAGIIQEAQEQAGNILGHSRDLMRILRGNGSGYSFESGTLYVNDGDLSRAERAYGEIIDRLASVVNHFSALQQKIGQLKTYNKRFIRDEVTLEVTSSRRRLLDYEGSFEKLKQELSEFEFICKRIRNSVSALISTDQGNIDSDGALYNPQAVTWWYSMPDELLTDDERAMRDSLKAEGVTEVELDRSTLSDEAITAFDAAGYAVDIIGDVGDKADTILQNAYVSMGTDDLSKSVLRGLDQFDRVMKAMGPITTALLTASQVYGQYEKSEGAPEGRRRLNSIVSAPVYFTINMMIDFFHLVSWGTLLIPQLGDFVDSGMDYLFERGPAGSLEKSRIEELGDIIFDGVSSFSGRLQNGEGD